MGMRDMAQITLDSALANKLQGIVQIVELCDPSGRVLGRFLPAVDPADWEPISPEVSDEELDRRASSQAKRYTTAEVLAHLERL
jgi:hypothetical protein